MEEKLNFCFIPSGAIAVNLRSHLKTEDWEIIRKHVYSIAGYQCEICGAKGKLTCHEEWKFEESGIMHLLELQCLCELCHKVKHVNIYANRKEFIAHYCEVNGLMRAQDFFIRKQIALEKLERLNKIEQWQIKFGKYDFLASGTNKFTRVMLENAKG